MEDATGGVPNPWAMLHDRPWIDLVWTSRLPPTLRAATDGRTIWIATGLSQRERRCALMHELIHIDLGHASHQPAAVERRVETLTATSLLPDLDAVHRALAAADGRLDCAAEELWVTDAVLVVRLAGTRCDPASRMS